MPSSNAAVLAIAGLVFFAFWLFIVLPFLHHPTQGSEFWHLKLGDIALILFTGLLAAFTYWLYRATKDLATMAKEQSKDTRILRRAYLSVEPCGVHPLFVVPGVVPHFSIRNSGHLPARSVSWYAMCKLMDNDALKDLPLWPTEGKHLVAPQAEMRQGITGKTYSELDNARDWAHQHHNNHFLYVWGVVYYDDGFHQNRTTKFCHRYNLNTLQRGDDGRYSIDPVYARQHQYGNWAD